MNFIYFLFFFLFLYFLDDVIAEDLLLDQMNPVDDDQAANYLQSFGYVNPGQINAKGSEGMAADVGDIFAYAVTKFQEFAGLEPTGVLDIRTKKKMAEPRCGMMDVENLSSGKGPAFKWKKNDLTYTIHVYTNDIPRSQQEEAIQKAFDSWGAVTPLTFRKVPPSTKADINIKFAINNHDDMWPFDGKGGVLAHAGMPPTGMLHFDDAENWVFMDAAKIKTLRFTDLLPVAIHEGGHALGLSHSKAKETIMAPFYQESVDRNGRYIYPTLKPDDIRAIQEIYGPRRGGNPGSARRPGEFYERMELKQTGTEQSSRNGQDNGEEVETTTKAKYEKVKKVLEAGAKKAINKFFNWLDGKKKK